MKEDFALNFKNILLKHNKCIVNSRSESDISIEIAGKKVAAPVCCANMKSLLNPKVCQIFDQSNWFHIYHRIDGFEDIINYIRLANEENWNFISPSIGVKQEDYKIVDLIKERKYRCDAITIDVAFSWQNKVGDLIKYIKRKLPNTYLIVGNGDNPNWISWLENLGVDAAKINIGTGETCLSTPFTGFGSSTITDLEKCANQAKSLKIFSDGGLGTLSNGEVCVGDIAKAIRFGASFVLSGRAFAICSDSPAQKDGYYGNASQKSKNHSNNIEGHHFQPKNIGRTIKEQIKIIEDSLKSSVSYSGGNSLQYLLKVDYQIIC